MDEIKNLKKSSGTKMVVVYACYLIVYIIRKMDEKFKRIYYSDNGYWRGKIAIQKLSRA